MSAKRSSAGPSNGRWLPLLQLSVGVGLIVWLARQAMAADVPEQLAVGRISLSGLALAALLLTTSIVLSFVRWRLVAAAAGLPMTLAEATRIGAVGFAANFVALGNIGGDVVKAALLAKNRSGQRALAITTVIVDRLLGLFALLLFASGGVLASGLATEAPADAVSLIARGTLLATTVACLCFLLAMAPGQPLWRLAFFVRRMPFVGRRLGEALLLLDSVRGGRSKLLIALGVGLITDAGFVGSFYAVAKALPVVSPSFIDHLLVVPLGMIAGALPISPSGLGTVEATIDLLYRAIASAPDTHGAIVAGAHRLLMIGVGAAAVVYYFASGERRRAKQAMNDNPSNETAEGSGTGESATAAVV